MSTLTRSSIAATRFINEIDPSKTVLLVLDMQKLIVDPQGAGHVKSVGGAPDGKDTIEPTNRVIDACRAAGMPVVWSLWGLRGDGLDKGLRRPKWPALNPGAPDSPASWGNRDAELDDAMHPRDDEPVSCTSTASAPSTTRRWTSTCASSGADTLVIAGVTSANCAVATALDGWNKNYKIVLLADTTTAVPAHQREPAARLRPALGGAAQHPDELRRRAAQQRVPGAARRHVRRSKTNARRHDGR